MEVQQMTQNNGSGYPAKVELKLGQEAKLKILRPVKTGKNGKDPYFLFRVLDLDTSEEKSLFAPADIAALISEQQLGVGSEFSLKRVQNGRNGGSLELSILAKTPEQVNPNDDGLKDLLIQSIRIVQEAVSESGIQFSNQEIQDLISTVFIQKTKLA
jgi:hypothetical protein